MSTWSVVANQALGPTGSIPHGGGRQDSHEGFGLCVRLGQAYRELWVGRG